MTADQPPPTSATTTPPPVSRAGWRRLAVVQLLQAPAVAIALLGTGPAIPWIAGLLGSAVCCAGTSPSWRWRNRALVLQAGAWLALALVFGLPYQPS